IAKAQLLKPAEKKDTNTPAEIQERENIIRMCNVWQQFLLTQEADGVDGTCEIYITCEHGKININELYDFEEKKYITHKDIDGKKIIEWLGTRIDELMGTQRFAESVGT